MSKGSSPSLSGWRFEFLQLSLRTHQAFTALHTVTNLIANATAPPALIDGLRLNPLTAKKRSDGRVRPLAAPETLRRLVAGTLCATYKPTFVDALAHHDHAIGVPAGTETLAKSIQAHTEATGYAVVKLDGTAAFNRQDRRVAFAAIQRHCPDLVPFAAQCYDRSLPPKHHLGWR